MVISHGDRGRGDSGMGSALHHSIHNKFETGKGSKSMLRLPARLRDAISYKWVTSPWYPQHCVDICRQPSTKHLQSVHIATVLFSVHLSCIMAKHDDTLGSVGISICCRLH